MADTESCPLYYPALEEIAGVLENGLKKNFAEVRVKVVDCPDLTQHPFEFPVKGLCGKTRIADVGDVLYMMPVIQPEKVYDINTIAKKIDLPGAYLLGAGASSYKCVGMNAEVIFSIKAESPTSPAVNGNYLASINPADNSCLLEKYREKYSDHDFGFLSNLYACEGNPGKVIEVKVKRRTGNDNFVSCMRKSLKEHYGDKSVGMGGSFIIQEGRAKLHIKPREYPACPLNTDEEIKSWMRYFEMKAPLICQSVFVSHDPGFDLRVEHTHCFSHHGEGGHYHYDTTPDSVEYLGYFHPAEHLYRIDRAAVTHMLPEVWSFLEPSSTKYSSVLPQSRKMADTESCPLYYPALEEIAGVLENGLKKNFAEVRVKVVDCPDLTQHPFEFPVKGLCGKTRIADVGGVPYLMPVVQPDKVYDINTIAKKIDLPGAYLLGAGASSYKCVGMNAEVIFSIKAESPTSPAVNGNYLASINPADNSCLLEKYREKYSDHDFGFLSNLYASEGNPGKVIEVKVKRRTGDDNFVSCMRKSLKEHYGDKSVGMGGSFIIQEGRAKLHIMPREYPACPLNTDEEIDSWMRYFEMKAPLICQSVFVSHDPGFDLRVEHTHCFSHHGEGGHYHYDTTPDSVEYLGYFHPAEHLYRIDRPAVTHMVGGD